MSVAEKEKRIKEKFLMEFGEHLKAIRKSKGLTAAEVSRRMDIDKPNYTRIESGRINPSLFVLRKISTCLDISLEELFKGFKNKK